jgi:ligand-binding sensor domain-containing protein/serine phosphatase RsbU (regulator of sigma subunit)
MPNPLFPVLKLKYLLAVTSLLVTQVLYGQRDAIDFKSLSVEDGLSQNTVYTIIQDHKGFMWFGTDDGLSRYDGYTFKNFYSESGKEGTLSNRRVIALLEDSKNRLWVGTIGGGLNLYNWETSTFKVYKNNPEDSRSLSNNRVMALTEDPSGKIWIGTADGGLNLFDPDNETFRVFRNSPTNPNLIPSNVIRSLFVDSKGILWIGSDRGIATYNIEKDLFERFSITGGAGKPYEVKIIRGFFEDRDGNIWIATDESGLIRYTPNNRNFEIFRFSPHNTNTIPSNTVHDIHQDEDGVVWIATFGGLSKFNPKDKSFINYIQNLSDKHSIASNLIRKVYEDNLGIVWIGTANNGVSKFNRNRKKFTIYRNYPENIFSLPSTTVRSVYEDGDGIIWLGTYGEGLISFEKSSETFKYHRYSRHRNDVIPDNFITSIAGDGRGKIWIGTNNGIAYTHSSKRDFNPIQINPEIPTSLPETRIRNLYVDRNNTLWVATLNNGLSKLLPDGKSFQTYKYHQNKPYTISQNRVTYMFEDRYNNFWVATSSEGLNLFDREGGVVSKLFKKDDNDSLSIASDRVLSFYQDTKDRFWIGTSEGLCLYNYSDSSFFTLSTRQGLPNDVIYGILEDGLGRLWMSTNKGISCLDFKGINDYSFRNYDKYDGFPTNEFSEGAFLKLRSGEMLFGGANNFIIFYPFEIVDDTIKPRVYITEARIEEKGVRGSMHKEFVVDLLETDSLVLSYRQCNISLYIKVLHFSAPEKNRYMYMLEGYDHDWISPMSFQRFIKYTNLKPGEYTFRVKGRNPDGYWNEEGDSFHFTIKPPFWLAWWFYVLVALAFLLLILGVIKLRERVLIQQKHLLAEMVADRTLELTSQREELLIQSERLQQANEEIRATSEALADQNEMLKSKNEEITEKSIELEDQKNSLANLAWELQDKNEEITAQRNEIERQKKEITDSILYAQRIQQAVLPSQEQIKDLFSEFFIFNRPKSIVSGDFYWATRAGKHRIIAIVDCTGHGVPGGFMSMLGVLMLNEVISLRGIFDPAQALNQLRQGIISVLHQKGEFGDAPDGMDISLCVINDETSTLSYAGANSSIIIYNPANGDDSALQLVRSDRMPIAYHPFMKSFKSQNFKLTKGTTLFLFTDGLVDQFGGPSNKKFQQKRMQDFIVENRDLPMETQGIVLEQLFDSWKGETYQVDDLLVVGLKV